MRDPYRITVEILHGDYAEIGYPLAAKGTVYHQIALAGGERIGFLMRVLGAAYPHDQVVRFGCALGENLHMAKMQRLEPPYHQGVAGVLVVHRTCDTGKRI